MAGRAVSRRGARPSQTPTHPRGRNTVAARAAPEVARPCRKRERSPRPRRGATAGSPRRQLTQWRAFTRLLPRTDVFHFYFGLTLVPKSLQFPLLRLTGRRSVFHFLGSDIRGKSPGELAYGRRAGAQIVGSYDAIRWVPEAEVVPPGIDLAAYEPVPPSDRPRPLVVHAPSNRTRKGTEHVVAACREIGVELNLVEGLP